MVCGVDLDPACEYPFKKNNGVPFLCKDVAEITGEALSKFFPKGATRLLAGCAPCRPFSPLRRGADNSGDDEWCLLDEFGRLVRELEPELVTMENVPDLASKPVFDRLIETLAALGYHVDWDSVYCPRLGVPQCRRRLVLLGSLLGPPRVPRGSREPADYKTVRSAIGSLPPVKAGKSHPADRLHAARSTSAKNARRLRASTPGGTWLDWPKELRAKCHRRKSGSTYGNVYARMSWDEPSPTITTLAYSFGSGRFGHPEQDRSLTLREAALLQSFPRKYRFVEPGKKLYFSRVGRLIGNAVPPTLARAIGRELVRAAAKKNALRAG
jgi:DNA (cytosine-5)-methyltransferase 1